MTAVPDLMPLLPELVMAVGAMVLLMIGVFAGDEPVGTVTVGAVILIVVAAALLLFAPVYGTTFEGAFILDPFARFMKILTLIGSGFAIVMTTAYARAARFERFEYPVLVVLATVGIPIPKTMATSATRTSSRSLLPPLAAIASAARPGLAVRNAVSMLTGSTETYLSMERNAGGIRTACRALRTSSK